MTADSVLNFFRSNRGLPFRTMTVFNFLLEAALAGGIMILLLLVVRRFFRKQVGSRAICFTWLLIAVRLLVPLSLPNPLMNELRPTNSIDVAARPVADQFRVRFQDAVSDIAWEMNYEARAAQRAAGIPASEYEYTLGEFISDVGAYTSYGWTGKWFFFAYLAIAGGVAIWITARNLHDLHRMKKSRFLPLSDEDSQTYMSLCQEMQLSPLPAYYVGAIRDVRLAGLWRPYVAISSTLKPEATRPALIRALQHYKARDHWWSVLRYVCCAVQWFNPLVWIGAALSRKDCALAWEERMAAEQAAPSRRRLQAIFAAACCLVLVCSFATSETQPLASRTAAEVAAFNDGGPLPRDILNEQEAIALAESYIFSGLLHGSDFTGISSSADISAYHDGYGWHVTMLQEGSNRFLLLSDQGHLKAYDTDYCLEEHTVQPGQAMANDTLLSIARSYVAQCLYEGEITNFTHVQSTACQGKNYATVSFSLKNESCTMTVCADEGYVTAFSLGEDHGSRLSAKDVLPIAVNYLMEHWGIDAQQARIAIKGFMPGYGYQMQCVVSEQTSWFSQELAAEMKETYGQQDRYSFLLEVDAATGEVQMAFLPQAAYANQTDVLDTQTAAKNLITYEILQGRYVVQTGLLPAGASFDVLSVANVYADRLVTTGGTTSLTDITLVRFTHPVTSETVSQWVQSDQLEDNTYMDVLSAQEIQCTVNGQTITLKGYDWQYTDGNVDGFYGDPIEGAVSIQRAAEVALAAIQAEYGIAPKDFEPLPVNFGFYCNRESSTPIIHWRIDLPDPRSSNMDFEVYVAPNGEIDELFGPEEGNG